MEDVMASLSESSIPQSISSSLSDHMDTVSLNGKNVLQRFMKYNRQKKQTIKETHDYLQFFMQANKTEIMKLVGKHNIKKGTQLTFENMIEIAIGWDIEDVDTILKLAKKRKFREFTNTLFAY